MEKKTFSTPDEKRSFDKGQLDQAQEVVGRRCPVRNFRPSSIWGEEKMRLRI